MRTSTSGKKDLFAPARTVTRMLPGLVQTQRNGTGKGEGLESSAVDRRNARLQSRVVGVVLREHERHCALLLTWLAGLVEGLVTCAGGRGPHHRRRVSPPPRLSTAASHRPPPLPAPPPPPPRAPPPPPPPPP